LNIEILFYLINSTGWKKLSLFHKDKMILNFQSSIFNVKVLPLFYPVWQQPAQSSATGKALQ
jgi:hypothetical protein